MNQVKHVDAMDALLYSAMPFIQNRELEEIQRADPSIKMSDRNYNKLQKKLRRKIGYFEQEGNYSQIECALKRVAILVLVIMAIGFTCMISVEASRTAFWEAVVEWYEEKILFKYLEVEKNEALDKIEEYKEPILSEAYQRTVLEQNEIVMYIEYSMANVGISYTQSIMQGHSVYESNDETKIRETTINGNEAYIFESDGYFTIIWSDNLYIYHLSGNLILDELIAIAESIK